jgi:hypothetical protein
MLLGLVARPPRSGSPQDSAKNSARAPHRAHETSPGAPSGAEAASGRYLGPSAFFYAPRCSSSFLRHSTAFSFSPVASPSRTSRSAASPRRAFSCGGTSFSRA